MWCPFSAAATLAQRLAPLAALAAGAAAGAAGGGLVEDDKAGGAGAAAGGGLAEDGEAGGAGAGAGGGLVEDGEEETGEDGNSDDTVRASSTSKQKRVRRRASEDPSEAHVATAIGNVHKLVSFLNMPDDQFNALSTATKTQRWWRILGIPVPPVRLPLMGCVRGGSLSS